MSRGPGRLMRAVCEALRGASGPLTVVEIATAVYGTRTLDRHRRGRRRRVTLPVGDTSNLRRALNGLIGRGAVVVVGGPAVSNLYALSDRCTGNNRGPTKDVRRPVPALSSDALAVGEALSVVCVPWGGDGTIAVLSPNDTTSVVRATSVMVGGLPANEVALESVPAESRNDSARDGHRKACVPGAPTNSGDDAGDPTTHRVPAGSSESSRDSVRLTSAGLPLSVRGALPLPAKVLPWERALLSTIVNDLLRDLSHATNQNDDSDS